jgi:hypothetical protein
MDFLGHQQWVIIAVVFFGIIGYISWMRWRDRKWIDARLIFSGKTLSPVNQDEAADFYFCFPTNCSIAAG